MGRDDPLREESFDEELERYAKDLKKAVEKVRKRYLWETVYVGVRLQLLVRNDSDGGFKVYTTVIDDEKDLQGSCLFCGKPTFFYDERLVGYVCADCYGKIASKRQAEEAGR